MPLEKQSLNNFLPDGFETLNQEGYKTNFSEDKIKTGYEKDIKDRVSGPNLNNLIDVIGKNTNVLSKFLDFIKSMPINSILKINNNNEIDYEEIGDINNKVSKSGDTMTGNLRLNNASLNITGGSVFTRNTTYALDDKASTAKYEVVIQHEDKNNVRKSRLESAWLTDGSHTTNLSEKKSASENSYATIAVGWDKDGKAYATAPTPTTGDNSTKIATTAWVNNSKNNISTWGFPSTKYDTLTLGADGSSYTAPANGWFSIVGEVSTGKGHVVMTNGQMQSKSNGDAVGTDVSIFMPAKKGDTVKVNYINFAQNSYYMTFTFTYAEGAK